MAEIVPLRDAITAFVRDGDSALEGLTHLIPFAAGHHRICPGRNQVTSGEELAVLRELVAR